MPLTNSIFHYYATLSLRFQGFPESFKIPDRQDLISQCYRQIGNAVSPPCVAAVAETVLHHLVLNTKSTVFDLVLKASPNKAKVQTRIHALLSDSSRSEVSPSRCYRACSNR